MMAVVTVVMVTMVMMVMPMVVVMMMMMAHHAAVSMNVPKDVVVVMANDPRAVMMMMKLHLDGLGCQSDARGRRERRGLARGRIDQRRTSNAATAAKQRFPEHSSSD